MSIGNWLRSWKRSQKPVTVRRTRLGLEALEDRVTPSVSVSQDQFTKRVTVSISGNDDVTISSEAASGDTIGVTATGSGFNHTNYLLAASLVINDTSGGQAFNQKVTFSSFFGSKIDLSGSIAVNNIETISLACANLPVRSGTSITIASAVSVRTIIGGLQLSADGPVNITARGSGDAIGTANLPIGIGSKSSLYTDTSNLNGNQYFDLGGGYVNAIGSLASGSIDAGFGTVTLTRGEFYAIPGKAPGQFNSFGDNTTFNLGTGGFLSVGSSNETISGLTGSGTIGTNGLGSGTLTVGGPFSMSSRFDGSIVDVTPGNTLTGTTALLTLAKTGNGTFTLNGANSFTGGVNVNAGKLAAIGGGAVTRLANNALVTVASGAIFELGDVNPTPQGTFAIDMTLNGGTFQMTGATNDGVHVRNLTFNNGGTVRTVGSVPNYNNTNLAVNGTITVSGSSSTPASIDLRNGLLLTGNRTFNVADITGNTNPDLTISATTGIREVGTVASITKTGTGTMVSAADNTYTGSTTISSGSLQFGNGGPTGFVIGSGLITNNGNLTFNRTGAYTVSNNIVGSGSLLITGGATMTLIGTVDNTYTGSGEPAGAQILDVFSGALADGIYVG